MKATTLVATAALTLCISTALAAPPNQASTPTAKPAAAAKAGGYVAKSERGQLAQQIVRKWAGYVQEVYGTTPMTWSKAMNSTFAQADLGNLRSAAKFQTYEAMSAALLGQKASDGKIIDALAKNSSKASVKSLGSSANDLVYTMIDPCRIVDTRLAVGSLSANIARDFISHGASFATQGGAASTCNIPANPSALVLNVTVLGAVGGPSHIRLYPYGVAVPPTVSVYYDAGERISNEVIVKTTTGQPLNFSAISGFGTHIVIDVAGYFMAPVATALECIRANESVVIAAGAQGILHTECPAGYMNTGGGCGDPAGSPANGLIVGWNTRSYSTNGGNSWFCSARNPDAVGRTLTGDAVCCRVPGR